MPFESPVKAGEVVEAHIISNGKDFGLLFVFGSQHFFRFLDPVAIDKLVKILMEFFVDYLREMMGRKRQFAR
jgi:hypothetical protein